MTTYYTLGLMSGTSLDGLDIAYIEFKYAYKQWHYSILHAETILYTEEWKNELRNAITLGKQELGNLDKKFSAFLAECTKDFIEKNEITSLDLISSHGHTIHHRPDLNYTYQIGNSPEFGNAFNIPVVCDFRVQDVELGGQGAPLVPIGDRLLFSDYNYCLNLGGIANLSTEYNNERIAYDICASNIILNYYANKLGHAYDPGGIFARYGETNKRLLEELNSLDYYRKKLPKSLGREWIDDNIMPLLEKSQLSIRDILHTYCQHIAQQINNNIPLGSRVLITGGGVYNTFLLQLLDTKIKWIIPEKKLIDYKEATIFALLGILRLRNQPNCLKSYTGARKDHCSGVLYH